MEKRRCKAMQVGMEGSTVRNKDYRGPLFNKSVWELNLAIYKIKLHSKIMLFTCTCMRQGKGLFLVRQLCL